MKAQNLEEKLYTFFMWFRENGETYIDHCIEDMIKIYIKEREAKCE